MAIESDGGGVALAGVGLAVPVVESAGHQHCPSCIATMTSFRFLYRLCVDQYSTIRQYCLFCNINIQYPIFCTNKKRVDVSCLHMGILAKTYQP